MSESLLIHSHLVFVDAGNATYEVYKQYSGRGWIAGLGSRRTTSVHKMKGEKSVQRLYSPPDQRGDS